MLSLLLTVPKGVEQSLAHGDTAGRIVSSICKGTSKAETERVSQDPTGMWTLWLYRRNNAACMEEAGVVYEMGPEYDSQQNGEFPGEVLRFFSMGKECYETAVSHYEDLFVEYDLIPLVIARNIRPM